MAASRRKSPPKRPARRPARKPVHRVLGVDVDAWARQLLAESGGDVHRAKRELEAALVHLRDHLHAEMELKMRAVKLP